MPQMIILNHAADVNYKRMQARSKVKSIKDKEDPEDPIVNGKKLSEFDDNDLDSYFKSGWHV